MSLTVKQESINKRIAKIAWLTTAIFLCFGFFTPIKFKTVFVLAYSLSIVILSIYPLSALIKRKSISRAAYIATACLLCATLTILLCSPFDKTILFRIDVFLVASVLLIFVIGTEYADLAMRVFYVLSTIVLLLSILVFYLSPEFYVYFDGYWKSNDEIAPLIYGASSKNLTALFVFIYFVLSVKKGYKLGIALGLIYPFIYFGRQYILMLVVFCILFILLRNCKRRISIKPLAVFLCFVLSVFLMFGVSSFWVDNMVSQGTSGYKETLNDGSNAMRTKSNLFALDLVANNPAFLIYGYDSNIFEQLGISPTDFSREANYYIDGKYRLVQADEEVINLILKEGIFFAIAYYFALSLIIARLIKRPIDLAYFVAYFVGSLILHSMFTLQFMLLFLIVLALNEDRHLKQKTQKQIKSLVIQNK